MKKINLKNVISKLNSKKGASIFEYLIIIAIVAIIAVVTLPPLMKTINSKANTAIKEVDKIDSIFISPEEE